MKVTFSKILKVKKRQQDILLQLNQKNTVNVAKLANIYNVSGVTIRRDLEQLQKQGLLFRTHGGAILIERRSTDYEFSYSTRKIENILEKEKIARTAANLIEDEEAVIIDAGTTTGQIPKFISEKKNLVIITNSIYTSLELGKKIGITVILIGGLLKYDPATLAGIAAEEFLNKFYAKKLFLGVGGISIEHGITYFDLMENELRKVMLMRSEVRIVLADHTKFNKVATVSVGPINSVNKIITDNKTPENIVRKIREMGVEVIIAD